MEFTGLLIKGIKGISPRSSKVFFGLQQSFCVCVCERPIPVRVPVVVMYVRVCSCVDAQTGGIYLISLYLVNKDKLKVEAKEEETAAAAVVAGTTTK